MSCLLLFHEMLKLKQASQQEDSKDIETFDLCIDLQVPKFASAQIVLNLYGKEALNVVL